ncbi:MAG: GNAT family N-acetyltransferase [Armatimonadetes bacterium]|nr:GNAT family N-acetyltransferase [Armatimonadota bacterium]
MLTGFGDPACSPERWDRLIRQGDTNAVNMTWLMQRAWWEDYGRGQLLLILAERDGEAVALAPLFADGGMVYNLCPEDHLDFVGSIDDPRVLESILVTAREQVRDFIGFRFYFVPDASRTGRRLADLAPQLGMACYEEGSLPSPYMPVRSHPDQALAATRKKSLVRHEKYFLREGVLSVLHLRDGEEILPHLPAFFEQHKARREATDHPSIFCEPVHRQHYERMTRDMAQTGWLRFTRLDWNGAPVAFHWGLCYQGRYLWGVPSFDVRLSPHSPGEVLLRQALLDAIEEDVEIFDFGIGDESYKYRFATHNTQLQDWGLYPVDSLAGSEERER